MLWQNPLHVEHLVSVRWISNFPTDNNRISNEIIMLIHLFIWLTDATTAHDLSIGRVGPPLYSNNIRLVSWEEGGYTVTDKPFPRGEIILGGDNIALGYYKMPDHDDFFEDDGRRWIRTGDIGEVHHDGVFKIIGKLSCNDCLFSLKTFALNLW